MIGDRSFIRNEDVAIEDCKLLTNQEYIDYQKSHQNFMKKIENTDELTLFEKMYEYEISNSPKLKQDLDILSKKHKKSIGARDLMEADLAKLGKDVVAKKYESFFIYRYMWTKEYTKLMYNELARVSLICFWSDYVMRNTLSSFPKLKGKSIKFLPFIKIPKTINSIKEKYNSKNIVMFVKSDFGIEGEHYAYKIFEHLPNTFTLDLIGTTKKMFVKGLQSIGLDAPPSNTIKRISFHHNISSKKSK